MLKIDNLNSVDFSGIHVKNFQKLMKHRVRDILLVSSLYDNYLFEEDGQLYELIQSEFQTLNLSHPPEITHVTSGYEAIDQATVDWRYDLIITTLHIEGMHVIKFAQAIRKASIKTPIVVLAYDNEEMKELIENYDTSIFERIFIWQGDYRLLIAIVKYLEDKLNVENDTAAVGVQSIILVEDNIKFYSRYLPLVYTEILNQSKRLISEGVNITHRLLRMKARPKILLCSTYEEAWYYFEKYQDFVLGVISDIDFLHNGKKDPEAGFTFAENVRQRHRDIPILLQTSNQQLESRAKELETTFLLKDSPRLSHKLRKFILENFGFGDFIFKTTDGKQVGRATDLKSLEEQLNSVPEETIKYHADHNHFSVWLKARTEFWLANKIRPGKVSDFASINDLRADILSSLRLYREIQQRGVITEFDPVTFDPKNSFARIGGGSLGGKARGLGFINNLINIYNIRNTFQDVEISVPSAVVIATDIFEQFVEENNLLNFSVGEDDDAEIRKKFIEAPGFPEAVKNKLADFIKIIKDPLAIRSSSMLEDSQYQPFAGVYQTFMIPNNNQSDEIRLNELLQTIKLVYASTFFKKVKDYMKVTAYKLEEEKMAVIIQRLVGSEHNGRFYPDFAGVAKSYNFYPVPPQKATDGIVLVALGLGKTVVEGGNTVRFCHKYPRHLNQFINTKEAIRHAQQNFFALNLKLGLDDDGNISPEKFVEEYDTSYAEEDQTLSYVGSTYSLDNDTVYDGISRSGKRIITFAPILKHKIYPLPEILDVMLTMGTWGMGTEVEIEFAANMGLPNTTHKEFAMLQIRPLVLTRELEELNIQVPTTQELICGSDMVLGNGVSKNIHDIVFVDIQKYERSKSKAVADEVRQFNEILVKSKRPYVLIGVGRWGSLDPWLGIPVTWDQISGACTIVESGFKDINVSPSQGSHFFSNITSFKIGYFTIGSDIKHGYIDWDWLRLQEPIKALEFTSHIQFASPITVKINGQKNTGIILKPDNC